MSGKNRPGKPKDPPLKAQREFEESIKGCREDFGAYVGMMSPRFELAMFHNRVMDALEKLERGDIKRLMLWLPPRHSKSHLASEFFPAWFLGRNPDKFIIAASYAQELALDFGRKVRDQLRDPIYRSIFPECSMRDDSSATHRFQTTKGGVYYAVGVGGPLTGRGANCLILDDPIKNESEAGSETFRANLKSWYQSVAYTRLQRDGSVLIINTRWHEDDLSGWLLNRDAHEAVEDWTVVSMPAVAECDDQYRKQGDSLWPEHFPIERLEQIRKAVGSRVWSALYQQRPAAAEGMIFKREWWRYYDWDPGQVATWRQTREINPQIPKFRQIIQVWDTAFKTREQNDRSAGITLGRTDNEIYVLDCWVGRVEFPELKRQAIALMSRWRPDVVYIEDKASGQSLIQELKRLTAIPLMAVGTDTDKVSRAHSVTPAIEAGNVLLWAHAPWLAEFLDELSSFPKAPHDDIVDSVTLGLDRMSHWRDPLALQPSQPAPRNLSIFQR